MAVDPGIVNGLVELLLVAFVGALLKFGAAAWELLDPPTVPPPVPNPCGCEKFAPPL
jgi:hypothetical protein